MDESTGNILGMRVTGKLTAACYRDVLAPRIHVLLERFPTLKVLFLMDQNFEGWSLGAAWANTLFDLKHRRDFEKIAMVGAPKWEEWCDADERRAADVSPGSTQPGLGVAANVTDLGRRTDSRCRACDSAVLNDSARGCALRPAEHHSSRGHAVLATIRLYPMRPSATARRATSM
jgi:SpoIIAA-like